jgi:hypothetical protein
VTHPLVGDASQPAEELHCPSHRPLLTDLTSRPALNGRMDAIVVPATRSVGHLELAMQLAQAVGCVLVVFCSRAVAAEAVDARARQFSGLRWIAIDVPPGYRHALLNFSSTEHRNVSWRRSDLSLKRNLGLLLARLAGWERIFFLDDDIIGVSPEQIRNVAGWLGPKPGQFTAAGLRVVDFPDNSVVCHAYRRIGGAEQDVFVTGSALGAYVGPMAPFFPQIYNEDWFYFFDDVRRRSVAAAGFAGQLGFDPFDVRRARSEEFGDVIAEGLMSQLAYDRQAPRRLGRAFWRKVLVKRRTWLEEVSALAKERDDRTVYAAVLAALEELDTFTAEDCVRYIVAWQDDLDVWERRFCRIQAQSKVSDALRMLFGELKWFSGGVETAQPPVASPAYVAASSRAWLGSVKKSNASPGRTALTPAEARA